MTRTALAIAGTVFFEGSPLGTTIFITEVGNDKK